MINFGLISLPRNHIQIIEFKGKITINRTLLRVPAIWTPMIKSLSFWRLRGGSRRLRGPGRLRGGPGEAPGRLPGGSGEALRGSGRLGESSDSSGEAQGGSGEALGGRLGGVLGGQEAVCRASWGHLGGL